jgi:hypothetical protein
MKIKIVKSKKSVFTVKKLAKSSLLAVALCLTPALLTPVSEVLGLASFTFGQVQAGSAETGGAEKKYKTKKSYSLRQKVFKDFSKVQKKTEQEDWQGALIVLKDIESSKSAKYNSYEKANLWNYFAWVNYSLDDFPKAIQYYEKVLKEEQLSDALKLGTMYTLVQLKFSKEDYTAGIKLLKEWMVLQPIVGADAYVLLAQGYYQIADMNSSLVNINISVDKYESKNKVPKENWYALQRAIYYDKGDNKKVISILEKMVKHYSKPTYWKQLSGMYGTVGREKDQLHALETAYVMNAVIKEKQLMNLAYLFMGADAPYKAAKVIEKGIKAKQIEETSKNLEVLATAWRLSQEVKKSIPVMEQAAKKSKSGNLYASLAGIYLDTDQYLKAILVANKALERGDIKRLDQLNIILGMSLVNLGEFNKSLIYFKAAAKYERSERFATQWADFAKSEIKREEQLDI